MTPGEVTADRFRSPALIGREREVGALLAMLKESAASPGARAAIVVGSAGIGKSRFAREIAMLAAERGTAVWAGRGDPGGRPAPFGVLGGMLSRLAQIAPGDPIAVRREKLRERVGRHVDPDALWETATVLGEAAGTSFFDAQADDSSRPGGGGGSTLLADLAQRAWEELLGAELAVGPVLLLVDDAHGADVPSMRLFDAALRNMAGRPLAVVALGRPEIATAYPSLFADHGTLRLSLGELTEIESRDLLRAFTQDRLAPATLTALAARSGGNPFVLEGLARAEEGGGSAHLPDTALAMAAARINGAPAETRRALRAASVLGDVVAPGDLAALLEGAMDAAGLAEATADARGRGLLEERPGGDLAFPSAVVREVAYSLFTEEERARAHRLAAQRLARTDRDPVVVAWHHELGGAPAQAIDPYRVAAVRALAANDFEAAIARARRAEACGAEGVTLGEVVRVMADAHVWRGETAAAEKEARRALGLLVPGSVTWLQAAAACAIAASRMGDLDTLHAAARDVEALVASRPFASVEPALRVAQVVAMSRLSIALLHAGDAPAAEGMLGRMHALRVAGALDELPFALGFAHRANAVRGHVRGELLAAFLSFDAAATSFERARALRDACVDHANAGFLKTELGQNDDAERRLTAALATAQRLGLPTVTANAQLNLCLLLGRRGAAIAAAAMGETALATYEKQGSPRAMVISLVYLARTLTTSGAIAAARERARRATLLADDVAPYRAYAFAAFAAAELAGGRPAEAVAAAESAMVALREVGAEEGEAFVRLTFTEALQAAGRQEDARAALFEADAALQARAARIADRGHRESFLREIPEHARTVEMAEALGVGPTSRARTMLSFK